MSAHARYAQALDCVHVALRGIQSGINVRDGKGLRHVVLLQSEDQGLGWALRCEARSKCLLLGRRIRRRRSHPRRSYWAFRERRNPENLENYAGIDGVRRNWGDPDRVIGETKGGRFRINFNFINDSQGFHLYLQ
uniref:Uncharacterized protein n=1 Tax=Opuntia streptacantha TaxID=393608 RepID=A0A7C9ALW0_OPUST